MKLKVCGMHHNINEVASIAPDYLGFIFYKPSARNFTLDTFKLNAPVKKVGVFVDEAPSVIIDKIAKFDLQLVQLHGSETPEMCNEIRSHGVELIKVFSVRATFDFSRLQPYEQVVDYFLFDTKGKLPGGNGYTFDWKVLNAYPSSKPYFLSGGIGLDQLDQLRSFLASDAAHYCYAIDVNSKFEIEPGLKDIQSLKTFKSQL